jgi:hypothetical protein
MGHVLRQREKEEIKSRKNKEKITYDWLEMGSFEIHFLTLRYPGREALFSMFQRALSSVPVRLGVRV